ncbi:ribbon-helix-helix protein, CopG family [Salinarimonas sp.]|uniref:FitA-like ribbon-helix-helix domain-containing protein n=1 Tax=Salinarimonas sp. TaxID=2766526 RepID=UPI0032D973AF
MADILVRNIDDDVAQRLREKARASGTSVSEVIRDAIAVHVAPSRAELAERARLIRAMSRPSSIDSTRLIREDRDNDEPYR